MSSKYITLDVAIYTHMYNCIMYKNCNILGIKVRKKNYAIYTLAKKKYKVFQYMKYIIYHITRTSLLLKST